MLMDNGAPWGDAEDQPWTRLTVWLMPVGVSVSHGRAVPRRLRGQRSGFLALVSNQPLGAGPRFDFAKLRASAQRLMFAFQHEWRKAQKHGPRDRLVRHAHKAVPRAVIPAASTRDPGPRSKQSPMGVGETPSLTTAPSRLKLHRM